MRRWAPLLGLLLAGCSESLSTKVLRDGIVVAKCGITVVYQYDGKLYSFYGAQSRPYPSHVDSIETACPPRIKDLPTIHLKIEK